MAAYGIPQSMMYNQGYGQMGNMFRDRSGEQAGVGNQTANPAIIPQFNTPLQNNNTQVMQAQQQQGSNPSWGTNVPFPIQQAPQQMQTMQGNASPYTPNQMIMHKYYGMPLSYYQNGGQNAPQGQAPVAAPQGNVPQGPVQQMPYQPQFSAQPGRFGSPVTQPIAQPVQQPQSRAGFIPGFM